MAVLIILSGILATIPLSIPGLYWVAWFALVPTIIVIKNTNGIKQALFYGWILGITLTIGSSRWLYYPLRDFSGLPWPLLLILLSAMFILAGLNTGLWAVAYKLIERGKAKKTSVIFIASSWVALEYLFNLILPYFPFGTMGTTQVGANFLLQLAEYGGLFLLSFIVLLINGLIYKLFTVKRLRYLLMILILLFAANYVSSQTIARLQEQRLTSTGTIDIGIVSTEISQSEKWLSQNVEEYIEIIATTSNRLFEDGADLVITPESALTFDYPRNSYYREKFNEIYEPEGYLLLGNQARREELNKQYNSAFLINSENEILTRYDKNDLIPGEVIPLAGLAEFFSGQRWGSVTAGEEIEYFNLTTANGEEVFFRVLICSEILYPPADKEEISNNHFIVNISNEAWFGESNLQDQMWQAARMRAVETRRPVVKAGNKAINGLVYPDGSFLKLDKVGIVSVDLYDLETGPTFYQTYGDTIAYFALFITLIVGPVYQLFRAGFNKNNKEKTKIESSPE
ncbi:MAG: apolipoprotein N-acyltransferase [Bacillota bacterium]